FLHTALRPLTMRLNARVHARTDAEAAYRLRVTCRAGDEPACRAAVLAAAASLPAGFRVTGVSGHGGEPGHRVVSAEVHGPRPEPADDPPPRHPVERVRGTDGAAGRLARPARRGLPARPRGGRRGGGLRLPAHPPAVQSATATYRGRPGLPTPACRDRYSAA